MTKTDKDVTKIDFRKEISVKLFGEAHIERCRHKFAELSDDEFIALMRKANELDADPLVGDIYYRRRYSKTGEPNGLTVMATIACMRNYADMTGEYAGDDLPLLVLERGRDNVSPDKPISCIVVDHTKRSSNNPCGIVYCTLGVYRLTGGMWRRHSHTVLWDDYVPLYNGHLDPSSPWATISHVMIAKVAEVGALRKAFPKLGAIYIEEEMTKAPTSDERETKEVDEPHKSRHPGAETKDRRESPAPARTGDFILTNMLDGNPLREIPANEYGKTIIEFLSEALKDNPEKVIQWFRANHRAREEFWHLDQSLSGRKDAVTIKRFETAALERLKARDDHGHHQDMESDVPPMRQRARVPRQVQLVEAAH